MCYTAHKTVR